MYAYVYLDHPDTEGEDSTASRCAHRLIRSWGWNNELYAGIWGWSEALQDVSALIPEHPHSAWSPHNEWLDLGKLMCGTDGEWENSTQDKLKDWGSTCGRFPQPIMVVNCVKRDMP